MPPVTQTDVFLFYPNLIGYGRIVTGIISFLFMPYNHVIASVLYIISSLLDAVDGHVARYYNQCTRLGAMLDQLTDRCATMALMMMLAHLYPRWMFLFQLSAVIDMASHWLHLHAADLQGAKSHKQSCNALLHLYYTSRPFLFCMCAGNEGFYCFLYLAYFTTGWLFPILTVLCFPVALVKTGISVVHLVTAAQSVADVDVRQRAATHQD